MEIERRKINEEMDRVKAECELLRDENSQMKNIKLTHE